TRRQSPICRWPAALRLLEDDPRGRSRRTGVGSGRSAYRARTGNRRSGRRPGDGRRSPLELREAPLGYAAEWPGEWPRPDSRVAVAAARVRQFAVVDDCRYRRRRVALFYRGYRTFSGSLSLWPARSPVLTVAQRR